MSNSNICTVTFINLQEKKIIKILAQPKKEKKRYCSLRTVC